MTGSSFFVRLSLTATLSAAAAMAQCTNTWQPGDPVPGVTGTVYATQLWDPDGPGIQQEVLVVGGAFTYVGDVAATNLAIYDWVTDTWSAFGGGAYLYAGSTYGSVHALTVMPNGDLAIGGDFKFVDGVAADDVAIYDGSTWQSLGAPSSTFDQIDAITWLPGGGLVVAGDFDWFTPQADNVAIWDGSSWSSPGGGFQYDEQFVLRTMSNGDVFLGGENGVRQWNGTAWQHIGQTSLLFNSISEVRDLQELPNGDLLAVGRFDIIDQSLIANLARWDGQNWFPYAPGVDLFGVNAAQLMPNGDLIVVGDLTTAGMVRRWDGVAWQDIGNGLIDTRFGTGSANYPGLYEVELLPNGLVLVGGNMIEPRIGATGLALWDSLSWSSITPGTAGVISSAAVDKTGAIVFGGNFWAISGNGARGVARFDGTTWTTFSTSEALYDNVGVIETLPNGDLVVAGNFDSLDGVPAGNIARWDGTSWSTFGTGLSSTVLDVVPLGGESFAVCGSFSTAGGQTALRTAIWDGTDWKPMGNIQSYVPIETMARLPSGEVVAGGDIDSIGTQVANHLLIWDGLDWQPWGLGANDEIFCLHTLRDGRLVAAGEFSSIGGIAAHRVAIYDGGVWSPLGSGVDLQVDDVLELPDGDLLFVGNVAPWPPLGGFPAQSVARWDGQSWSQVDGGIDGWVDSACMWREELIVTGSFLNAGSQLSSGWARLATNCPAAVVASGAGCTGSAGPVALTTNDMPWIGSSFDAAVSGTSAGGLAFAVFGTQPLSLPLASVIAEAQPGCDLLVQPDIVSLLVVPWGGLTTSLSIPNASALVGAQLFEQVVPLELDASATLVAVTASNRLDLTIGSF